MSFVRRATHAVPVLLAVVASRPARAQQHAEAMMIHSAHQDMLFRENAGVIRAFGLPDLSATPLAPGVSEVRVWVTADGAAGRTHRLLRVRSDTARVLGAELWLAGAADVVAPASAKCSERRAGERSADTARVFRCDVGQAGSVDARRVSDVLDSLHVRFLREQGELNDERRDPVRGDRRMITVEVRDGVAYRAYSYFDVGRDGFSDERDARGLAAYVLSVVPR